MSVNSTSAKSVLLACLLCHTESRYHDNGGCRQSLQWTWISSSRINLIPRWTGRVYPRAVLRLSPQSLSKHRHRSLYLFGRSSPTYATHVPEYKGSESSLSGVFPFRRRVFVDGRTTRLPAAFHVDMMSIVRVCVINWYLAWPAWDRPGPGSAVPSRPGTGRGPPWLVSSLLY